MPKLVTSFVISAEDDQSQLIYLVPNTSARVGMIRMTSGIQERRNFVTLPENKDQYYLTHFVF